MPALSTSFTAQQQFAESRQRQPFNELADVLAVCKEAEPAPDVVQAGHTIIGQQAEATIGRGAAEEAADQSQHLGLSPDGHVHPSCGHDATMQSGAGEAIPLRCSPGLEVAGQLTLTPADSLASCQMPPRQFSSFASEWGHLLRMAGSLLDEISCHASESWSFCQQSVIVTSCQAAEDRYDSVVSFCERFCIAVLRDAGYNPF